MATKTRVVTFTCPECRVEMFSRARHDSQICGCPFEMLVDGGFDYERFGGRELTALLKSRRYRFVDATRQELYEDWAQQRNKFGTIDKKGA